MANETPGHYGDDRRPDDEAVIDVVGDSDMATLSLSALRDGHAPWSFHLRNNDPPVVAWLPKAEQTLDRFRHLPHDWDSYGAGPVTSAASNETLRFLNAEMRATTAEPRISPTSSGGVGLQWSMHDVYLSIRFMSDKSVVVYCKNAENEVEGSLDNTRAALVEAIDKLSTSDS